MDRCRLDTLSIEDLIKEVRSYGLVPQATRERLIDQIMSHLEHHGPYNDFVDAVDFQPVSGSSETSTSRTHHQADDANNPRNYSSAPDHSMPQMFGFFTEIMKQQNELIRQVTQMVSSVQLNNTIPQVMSSSCDSSNNITRERSPILSSVPVAQAVNLLASQLPSYSGQDDEDIELWIDKIERVSRIHGVSDEVILLAACNKLNKIAKDWLDLYSGSVNDSWLCFKQAISKRFRREVPYQVIFQRVDNRKWNFSKESFQEYAMHKLKLMQNLRLPDKESINFLISGIGNASLRGMASLIQAENLDQFLDRMYSLTLAYGDSSNKSPPFVNKSTDKTKLKNEIVESGKDSLTTEPAKDVFCVYCRSKGHTRDDCFRLKKKEQYKSSPVSSSQLASIATVQEVAPPSTQSSPPLSPTKFSRSSQSSESSLVACIDTESTLSIGDNLIKVTALNNLSCSLDALLDTGSAVSFLRSSVLSRFVDISSIQMRTPSRSFKAINKSTINVRGEISTILMVVERSQPYYNSLFFQTKHLKLLLIFWRTMIFLLT
ncbi:hypothetical protein ALC57_02094 [Trachymyrmex cornetzi]|uniref:SAP domain-containing protein n=1 Tax=Trachymyrmex cornetzi TaxID=471704 RepID=A0A151JNX2_9HYME|nr:hypothetical protein ALC57_02094 [Trachymyrmex cornetzi]